MAPFFIRETDSCFSPVFSSFQNIFESNKFRLSKQQLLRWRGKFAIVDLDYAKARALRRIFIATLLSTALGVGSAVAPSQAAPTTPSSDTTPTESSAAVADECYIKFALADDLVLDVSAVSRNDGANVQLWNSNLSAAQKWQASYDSQGLATIINVASGKGL